MENIIKHLTMKQKQQRYLKSYWTCLIMLLVVHLSTGQINVTGTITDANDKLPLIGVNIIIQGTSNGTTTDLDGKYSVTVPEANSVLEYSYTGFEEKQVTVGTQTVIDLTLTEGATALDEVVVVGCGVDEEWVGGVVAGARDDGEVVGVVGEGAEAGVLDGAGPENVAVECGGGVYVFEGVLEDAFGDGVVGDGVVGAVGGDGVVGDVVDEVVVDDDLVRGGVGVDCVAACVVDDVVGDGDVVGVEEVEGAVCPSAVVLVGDFETVEGVVLDAGECEGGAVGVLAVDDCAGAFEGDGFSGGAAGGGADFFVVGAGHDFDGFAWGDD